MKTWQVFFFGFIVFGIAGFELAAAVCAIASMFFASKDN